MLQVDVCKLAFMTYGTRLKQALMTANKSRVALATYLGLSVQAVGQVINGGRNGNQTFTASNNMKAALYLGVDAHWLATGEGEPIAEAKGWPGTRFTLDEVHSWPDELIMKVEDFALGYLAALENTSGTVQKYSDNGFSVDSDGNLTAKLPLESKRGQRHGARNPVPPTRKAKG
jgi:transcriptional regulator with XRE-family HTH domain